MATVGTMGDVVFSVSSSRIRTFDDYKRVGSVKVSAHEIIGKKSVLEFTGLEPETITFSIQLRADRGVTVQKELTKLRNMRDAGKVFPLIIGGKPVSDNHWMITSLSEGVTFWTHRGGMISANVDVSLQEYVIDTQTSTVNQSTTDSYKNRLSDAVDNARDTIADYRDKFDDMTGGLF